MISGLIASRVQKWDYAPNTKNLILDYAKTDFNKLNVLKDYSEVFSGILIENNPKNK